MVSTGGGEIGAAKITGEVSKKKYPKRCRKNTPKIKFDPKFYLKIF